MELCALLTNKQENPHLQIWLQIEPLSMFQGTTKDPDNSFQKWKKRMSNTGAISTPHSKTIAPSTEFMSHQLMKFKCAMIPEGLLLVTTPMAQMLLF